MERIQNMCMIKCFLLYSPKFNEVSPLSPVEVHTIYLIDGTMLNCVLVFYTSEYLFPSFFFLLVIRRSCVASTAPPSDWSWGHNNQFTEVRLPASF